MKKQYRMSEEFMFQKTIKVYHNGELISSERMWIDEADERADQLEEAGYVYGYTQDEVDEARRIYEERLANLIGGKE
jgi:hypothetical protein